MCDFCKDNEPQLYPDLGDKSMMEVNIEATIISGDAVQGIRILQKRHVDYMGPEGVESRQETQCVYIPWLMLHQTFADILQVRENINEKMRNNEDSTD